MLDIARGVLGARMARGMLAVRCTQGYVRCTQGYYVARCTWDMLGVLSAVCYMKPEAC